MSDWIPLVVFGLFAFFGVLLPRLARRQAKWQRNLPPKDGTGREVRYEELEGEREDALDGDLDDTMEDERPVVFSPPRRPAAPAPRPRPAPPPTRPSRQPSPAMLAARAQARAPQAPRPRRPALIRNRAEARRGITLMAVLGPCRAFDPY